MKFFDAIEQARKGHIIRSTKFVSLYWNKETKTLKVTGTHVAFDPEINEDLLDKDDWRVIKEQHNFDWALGQLELGIKIRRVGWHDSRKIYSEWTKIYDQDRDFFRFTTYDLRATDWELAD